MMDQALTATDRLDILDLCSVYAWALDSGDKPGFQACFAPGAVFDDMSVRYTDFDQLADILFMKPGFRGRQHISTNHLIRGNTERATIRSFGLVLKWETATTNLKFIHMIARYEDVVVKQDGRWLFLERVVRPWNDLELPWAGPLPEGVAVKTGPLPG